MENNQNMLQKKRQWNTQMANEKITNPDVSGLEVEVEVEEEVVEKRDIRKNLLIARKKQLQRRKRGYGKLPGSLRR